MNKPLSLFLIVTLNMGCGVLKHNKGAASATPTTTENPFKAAKKPASDKTISITNLDASAHEYVSEEGEKMMVIGTFAKTELAAFISGSAETTLPLGYVRAVWQDETYSSHTEGSDPKPVETENAIDYPSTIAYLIQSRENPQLVSLAVAESKYEKLKPQSEPVAISYDDKLICTKFTISTGAQIFLPNRKGQTVYAECKDGENCTVYPLMGDAYASTAEGIQAIAQQNGWSATCSGRTELASQHATVNNTSIVTKYEIVLKSDFLDIAKSVTFSAEKTR